MKHLLGTPLTRTGTVDAVRSRLLELIESTMVKPGDTLPSEREMMSILGVGRSSLREALAGMVAQGILVAGAGRRYRVRCLTPPELSTPSILLSAQIAQLFEARAIIEGGIAQLAAVRANEEDFAELEACLESICRAQRSRRSTAPSAARFHALLARAAHNGFLEAQLIGLRTVMVQVGAGAERGTGSRFADAQWESHKYLLDVLRQRDPQAMRNAMLEHIGRFANESSAVRDVRDE